MAAAALSRRADRSDYLFPETSLHHLGPGESPGFFRSRLVCIAARDCMFKRCEGASGLWRRS